MKEDFLSWITLNNIVADSKSWMQKEWSKINKEIDYLKTKLNQILNTSNSDAEDKLKDNLTIYVNKLFETVHDSFKIRRELYLTRNAKDRIILDLDSSDSISISDVSKDKWDGEDLKIIELKISLDENDNEFYSLIQSIQEISKQILSSQNTDETSSIYNKAKLIAQRIKQKKYENIWLKEEILEQKDQIEKSKNAYDLDLLEAINLKK